MRLVILSFLMSIILFSCDEKKDNISTNKTPISNIKPKDKIEKINCQSNIKPNKNDSIVGYWWIDSISGENIKLFKNAQALLFTKEGSFFLYEGGKNYGFEEYLGCFLFKENSIALTFTEISKPIVLTMETVHKNNSLLLTMNGKNRLFLRSVKRSELYK